MGNTPHIDDHNDLEWDQLDDWHASRQHTHDSFGNLINESNTAIMKQDLQTVYTPEMLALLAEEDEIQRRLGRQHN